MKIVWFFAAVIVSILLVVGEYFQWWILIQLRRKFGDLYFLVISILILTALALIVSYLSR